MEKKKSSKANLEDKKNLFFLIGLVVSMGATLLAFEWKNSPNKVESLGNLQSQSIEEEFIPITREPEVKPPPPPPPQTVEVLNIVDNDVDINNELEIEDSEADDETMIDITPIVKPKEEKEEEQQDLILTLLKNRLNFRVATWHYTNTFLIM